MCVSSIPSWPLSWGLWEVQLSYLTLRDVSNGFVHGFFSLPAAHSQEINDSNVAEKWNQWKEMWPPYSVVSKVNKEGRDVQVDVLLTAIGPEAKRVFKLGISRLPRGKISCHREFPQLLQSVREDSLRAISFQFTAARAWRIVWSLWLHLSNC